ncbi:hypothetical protein ASL14_16015 [Paenibacillus sp. IHB B 3084]|uniref:hypothetical protein n=1 Tax=unclassified Paenibacillus TaxID=185978 RepID=UPI00071FEA4C|nr:MULTISPECIES: hypothetical protein [unclassified Paenibacillus]ALP37467.1 hypothetical protein ASL14_16015 [Paenibacillus sp. IHB B 3084]MBE0336663.1 hypothetical protein [Paenibacillus sp. 23TSA30-6]
MSKVQLSMPVAFLIENLRTSGEQKDVIIECIKKQDFSPLLGKVKEKTMDFKERCQTAEDMGDEWEEAIHSGYEFKFLHINGLKRLLHFRFNRIIDRDYEQDGIMLKGLYLDPVEMDTLQGLIGRQWQVIEEDNGEVGSVQRIVSIKLLYRNDDSF